VMLVLLHSSAALAPADLGRRLLDAALRSPIYKAVLVPQAKDTMVRTAEENGVAWREHLEWIKSQGPWELEAESKDVAVPEYYKQPFHAYEAGNLCWESAWEGEIASRAVGARNFPDAGADGEEAFRGAFDDALADLGANVPADGVVVDLGCGSGVSTRRIAERYPHARAVRGLDLSPHFLAVGRRLLELAPTKALGGGRAETAAWVNAISPDARVSLELADAARTGLESETADVVSLSLVIHELPPEATREVASEAFRILKPSGQLWITEMDFDTEGFSKLRANPLLFSLIRSTEPYLDVYADYQTSTVGDQPAIAHDLAAIGFSEVRLTAATGRHFALVATKGAVGASSGCSVVDRRREAAKVDTHLKTWEAKRG